MRLTRLIGLTALVAAVGLCGVSSVMAKKTVVRYYARIVNPGEMEIWQKVIDAFEAKFPNIDVKLENNPDYASYNAKLLAMMAGGKGPDVVFLGTDNFSYYADKRLIKDLTPLIKADKEFKLDDYWPIAVASYKRKGRFYGVPNDIAAFATVYNKDILDKNGIPIPKMGWTWSDFVESCSKATKDTNNDGKKDTWGTWGMQTDLTVLQAGGSYFDDPFNPTKLTLGNKEGIDALQWIYDLNKKWGVIGNNWGTWEKGKDAFFFTGRWSCPGFQKNVKFNWDIAPLPVGKQYGQYGGGSCWSILSSTKCPQETWEFVKFIGGYHGQIMNGKLNWMTAANKKVALSDEVINLKSCPKNYAAFTADMDHAYVTLIHPNSTKITDLMNTALATIWNGKASPKDAITRIETAVNKLLVTK